MSQSRLPAFSPGPLTDHPADTLMLPRGGIQLSPEVRVQHWLLARRAPPLRHVLAIRDYRDHGNITHAIERCPCRLLRATRGGLFNSPLLVPQP